MSLQIRRLSYALGAQISGIDIRKPLDKQSVTAIHAAFIEHQVLLFRGESLTLEQFIAFGNQFGRVEKNQAVTNRHPDYPEIFLNKPEPSRGPPDYVGEYWHTDQSYTLSPPMASLVYGIEVPAVGGDTLFANMYRAYEMLSAGMKQLLDGLDAVHVGGARRIDESAAERRAETKRMHSAIAQPVVRIHPESNRKALYLTENIKGLMGMTVEEGTPLLTFLCQHATRSQFVYRHQWQKDDVLMWDNSCVMHNAVGDYDRTQVRHMVRTTLQGTPSGYITG